ncbi:MAG: RcpC/CpaB family pilus assembly protein [Thermoleophilia bacterium]
MNERDTGETIIRTRRPLSGGEPKDSLIFRELLGAPTPEAPRLANAVPAGLRAIGLDLSAERALHGLLVVGDRVDVVASVSDPNGGVSESRERVPARLAYTILQSLEVLQISTGVEGRVKLTLAATPAEAERLVAAAENGAVWLTLVPPGDPVNARSGEPLPVSDEERRS